MTTSQRPVVVSGIQPNGRLHLGNYIGALSFWVENQDAYQNYLFLADLHAFTTPDHITAGDLRRNKREAAALFLAAGIDSEKSVIFLQSDVGAHVYLGWLLICATPMGWLERMTQFKSKSRREESVGAGLFTYPSLQAADILLYDADFVPVGEDQKQHVELTRDIAQRFNHLFGECLKMPQPLMRTSGTRIMGLDDPEEKMSKSLAERRPGHAIHLLDAPDTIREKLRGAKTDLGRETSFEKASPGVRNLLVIYQALTSEATSSIDEKFAGKGYHYLKDEVAEAVIATLAPIQRRYDEVMSAPDHLDAILRTGAERASLVANRTLGRVRERLGLH